MDAKLTQQFKEVEELRQKLFDSLHEYTHEQLNTPPQSGKWSPIQLMQHLVLAESGTVAYLRKKTLNTKSEAKSGLSATIRTWLLKLFLASPFKAKAPTAIAQVPEQATLAHTIELWNKTRHDLHAILEKVPSEDVSRELFRHPFGGRLNLYQMMAFIKSHFLHHEKQLWQALK